jgi:hypothetical protein
MEMAIGEIWQHDGGERHAPAPVVAAEVEGYTPTSRRSGPA